MLTEKMRQIDMQTQEIREESQKKVNAFATEILIQCQSKGFTVKEVEALVSAIKCGLGHVKYINECLTCFQYE